jgi:NADPH:quinone reductase-like Zn-dependent oxidoreductase
MVQGDAMRAVRIETYGAIEALELIEAPVPEPGPGQVLIEVYGSSINPADIAIRNGWMADYVPITLPVVMGIDVAGVVAKVGKGVTGLRAGDKVYGSAAAIMGGSGGFAEYAVSSPALLARAPAGLDLAVAGTLPLAAISALEAVVDRLKVESGSRVLVHGSPGGVGPVAVALSKYLGGHVTATARGAGVDFMESSGADVVVDTAATDLASLGPFDHTLDLVGADPFEAVAVTRPGGRVVGLRVPPDQGAAAERGISAELQGTMITTERLDRLRDFVEEGVVKPHVVQTFGLEEIHQAFRVKEAGGVHGKVAVSVR